MTFMAKDPRLDEIAFRRGYSRKEPTKADFEDWCRDVYCEKGLEVEYTFARRLRLALAEIDLWKDERARVFMQTLLEYDDEPTDPV